MAVNTDEYASVRRPHFVWDSPVFFDELDPNGVMHNSRHAVHVERAVSAWFESLGQVWERPEERHEDLIYSVREFAIEFLAPITSPQPLRIELMLTHVGRTSAVHRFRCLDRAGRMEHARGRRAIVKIDAATGRPRPWTTWFLGRAEEAGHADAH